MEIYLGGGMLKFQIFFLGMPDIPDIVLVNSIS